VVNASDKNKKTAFWIWLFTGMFGGHYYYVGRIGRGLLFTFTAGLFVFGWLFDIFAITGGYFKDANGAPLKNIKPLQHEKPIYFEPQPLSSQQKSPKKYDSQPETIQPDISIKTKRTSKTKIAAPVILEQENEMSDGKLIAIIVGIVLFILFLFLVIIPSL
jgi:TM2 domain-containing membrane protein YozV